MMNVSSWLSPGHLKIAHLCSIECELQRSGAESVGHMMEAWSYAQSMDGAPDHEDVLTIARCIEPVINRDGYRRYNVRVGASVKVEWERVPDLMIALLDATGDLTPAEWFREYEEVHPFGDGNGRSGLVLFNYLSNTLDDPDWAPDFWNDDRRRPGWGAPR